MRTGLNDCGETTDINVPVRYGSTDRVVSAIGSSNTQNKLHTLPMMSVYMTGIEMAPDRMHGNGMIDRKTFLEQGGVFPTDIKAVQRLMPIPYNLSYDLSIYASNTDQVYQMLEQILLLFDYDLQVQMDDAAFNWAKITRVSLEGINNEEQYPTGTERRILVWTLNFKFETWFSLPMELRANIINQINFSIGAADGYHIEEFDENGNLQPFDPDSTFNEFKITESFVVDSAPQPGLSSPGPGEPGYPTPGHFNASLESACSIKPRNT